MCPRTKKTWEIALIFLYGFKPTLCMGVGRFLNLNNVYSIKSYPIAWGFWGKNIYVTWRDDNGIMSEATFWLFSQITS
jgi:hypothetical protein